MIQVNNKGATIDQAIAICHAHRPQPLEPLSHHPCHRQRKAIIVYHCRYAKIFLVCYSMESGLYGFSFVCQDKGQILVWARAIRVVFLSRETKG